MQRILYGIYIEQAKGYLKDCSAGSVPHQPSGNSKDNVGVRECGRSDAKGEKFDPALSVVVQIKKEESDEDKTAPDGAILRKTLFCTSSASKL